MNSGTIESVELLLKEGADINVRNYCGRTPLHLAAFNGHVSTAEHLIRKGANINAKEYLGLTPLFMAAGTGNVKRKRSRLNDRNYNHSHYKQIICKLLNFWSKRT